MRGERGRGGGWKGGWGEEERRGVEGGVGRVGERGAREGGGYMIRCVDGGVC